MDIFDRTPHGLTAPASAGEDVTPNDAVDLAQISRALYIGGGGDVAVTMRSGDVLTFVGVPAGSFLAIRASRVMATDTTATNIVALW